MRMADADSATAQPVRRLVFLALRDGTKIGVIKASDHVPLTTLRRMMQLELPEGVHAAMRLSFRTSLSSRGSGPRAARSLSSYSFSSSACSQAGCST